MAQMEPSIYAASWPAINIYHIFSLCSFFTAHCLLLTVCYSLLTVTFVLLTTCCSLLTCLNPLFTAHYLLGVHCPLVAVHFSLLTDFCLPYHDCCSMFTYYCLLHIAHCSLFTAHCSLHMTPTPSLASPVPFSYRSSYMRDQLLSQTKDSNCLAQPGALLPRTGSQMPTCPYAGYCTKHTIQL